MRAHTIASIGERCAAAKAGQGKSMKFMSHEKEEEDGTREHLLPYNRIPPNHSELLSHGAQSETCASDGKLTR